MTKQEGSWVMITGAVLIVIGIWLGLYLRAHRVIEYPKMPPQARKKLGDDGDPPVVVSDGSFNGKSDYAWQYPGDTILAPQGAQDTFGKLGSNCSNMPGYGIGGGLVDFKDGGSTHGITNDVDISAAASGQALNLTITYGSSGLSITALTNGDLTNLTFIDLNHGWKAPSDYNHSYQSENGGASDEIVSVSYLPKGASKPTVLNAVAGATNASVRFCYK